MRRFAGLSAGKQLRHELDQALASALPTPLKISACRAVLQGEEPLHQDRALAVLRLCVDWVCEAPSSVDLPPATDLLAKVSPSSPQPSSRISKVLGLMQRLAGDSAVEVLAEQTPRLLSALEGAGEERWHFAEVFLGAVLPLCDTHLNRKRVSSSLSVAPELCFLAVPAVLRERPRRLGEAALCRPEPRDSPPLPSPAAGRVPAAPDLASG